MLPLYRIKAVTILFFESEILQMKKVLSLVLVLAMVACLFAACSGKTPATSTDADTTAADTADAGSDLAYVTEKGKLIVGITDFKPMDYQDEEGNWIGFDADMAKAFAESLGVEVEFVVIEWDYKVEELNGKTIDCVWNGMTLTDEVTAAMECSNAYCDNAQVVVVKADVADQYATAEACKDLSFAVESGSAGAAMAEENEFTYTEVVDQATAVQEVATGTSDAAIIDALMAAAMVGEGTGFANLTYTAKLNSEQYGVGFRKGSDMAAKLNEFFSAAYADGTLMACAETYGIQASIIEQ